MAGIDETYVPYEWDRRPEERPELEEVQRQLGNLASQKIELVPYDDNRVANLDGGEAAREDDHRHLPAMMWVGDLAAQGERFGYDAIPPIDDEGNLAKLSGLPNLPDDSSVELPKPIAA